MDKLEEKKNSSESKFPQVLEPTNLAPVSFTSSSPQSLKHQRREDHSIVLYDRDQKMGYHRLTSPAYHDEAEEAPLTNGESKEDGNPHRYKKPSSWKMRFITGISIAMNVVTLMLCAALYSKITSQLDGESKLRKFSCSD